MRRLGAVLALTLCACEAPAPATPVRALRQAGATIPPTPHVVGRTAGARLGASVAGCRFPGFVAGAPGENAALLRRFDGGETYYVPPILPAPSDLIGHLAGCEGPDTNAHVLSAGSIGLWSFPSQTNFTGTQPTGLALNPSAMTPRLLIGTADAGEVWSHVFSGTGWSNPYSGIVRGGGFGTAVAWHPNGRLFAASDPAAGEVLLIDSAPWSEPTPKTPSTADAGLIKGVPGGFGSALLFGDVHPLAGIELLVADQQLRTVSIFGTRGARYELLMEVGPFTAGGGVSRPLPLALEPFPLLADAGLRAFWVGLPEEDVVLRFVGDAGEASGPGTAMDFGYSLDTVAGNLLIGAPGYDDDVGLAVDVGGVFGVPFNTVVIDGGEAKTCDVTQRCVTTSCEPGRCLGGVICVRESAPALCSLASCVLGVCLDGGVIDGGSVDAGVLDAGVLDAGVLDAGVLDAGTLDAGLLDAGTVDAGTLDAGTLDAGEADGGKVVVDGGAPDGGKQPPASDAGLEPLVFQPSGCSTVGLGPAALVAWLLRRRRREPAARSTAA